ncbi:MAG: hypothetical protein WC794_03575 [Candidatus Doudnabacteria bacterium]|jgi:hypothetical protein
MLDFIQSKKLKWVFIASGSVVVLLLVFQLGVLVGLKKAGFSRNWGENYSRNFGMPPKNPLGQLEGREFFGGHGVAGEVIKIEPKNLVIKGQDEIEKVVNLLQNTIIRRGNKTVNLSEIKIDDGVVIIGSPNPDGTVTAKMIRIFDSTMEPQPYNPNPIPPDLKK